MFVETLQLRDFRSYEVGDFTFSAGPTMLVGPNGLGKTNVLESLVVLATTTSHRVAGVTALIRSGQPNAVVRAVVVAHERRIEIDLQLNASGANTARIGGGKPRRPRALAEVLRVVLFAPEDLTLVRGEPSQRRRLLDDVAVARQPRLAATRAEYERVIRQRTALLKAIRAQAVQSQEQLEVWDERLCSTGAEIVAARGRVIELLRPRLAKSYAELAVDAGDAAIRYVGSVADSAFEPESVIAAALQEELSARRGDEIDRAQCLVGPHRDDLEYTISSALARTHASQGEAWSLAIASRLATYELLADDDLPGGTPVLLLDDVFATLDPNRRAALADLVVRCEQVLVTAAAEIDVPAVLRGTRIDIEAMSA